MYFRVAVWKYDLHEQIAGNDALKKKLQTACLSARKAAEGKMSCCKVPKMAPLYASTTPNEGTAGERGIFYEYYIYGYIIVLFIIY